MCCLILRYRPTPDLLQTLDDTSSSDPNFGSSSGFITEVETEEEETGRRCSCVQPNRDSLDDDSRRSEWAVERRESNEGEGATEDDPRCREDIDGWLHSEKCIPSERTGDKDGADDVKIGFLERIGSGKQTELEGSLIISHSLSYRSTVNSQQRAIDPER